MHKILDQIHELRFVVDLEKHFADALLPKAFRQRAKLGVDRVPQHDIANRPGKFSRLGIGEHRLLNVSPVFKRNRRRGQLVENRLDRKRVRNRTVVFLLIRPGVVHANRVDTVQRLRESASHHVRNPRCAAHSRNRQPVDPAKIPVERELLLSHVIQAAQVHVVHASGKRGTHHIQVPIILRAVHYDIRAVQKLRQFPSFPNIRKNSSRFSAPEFQRHFVSTSAIEIRDRDPLYLARPCQIVHHGSPHHPRA